ncbi:MAG: peptidase T [Oscillospiraceae bacterium]|nr:peptidase T [Oscillospiraceae bacterium]
MKAYERFLKYVQINTASSETSETTPSTACQFDLSNLLAEEMREIGVSEVYVDEHAYVYGVIPASEGLEEAMSIGFIAHLDTIPDFPGENVKPRLIENYDGGDIVLGDSGRTLSPADFPHLPSLKGRSLIVTDGTTVLGADNKAGVAEIMEMAETIIKENLPHGRIAIGFCPDEEIGHGASLMDLERFGAKVAYTADGGAEGGVEYENFNACGAKVSFNGFNVHPGSAKDTMINASLVAMEFNSMLPAGDTPRDTEGYEGFFHLTSMEGDVEKATLNYIVRDHDAGSFEARRACLAHVSKLLNKKYGEGTVALEIKEHYRNMCEAVKPHFHVVENALEAIKEAGIEPVVEPIRGGTDGAQLTFRGLPCPNLGTGGYAYHGPYEHISLEGLDISTRILLNIVKRYAK